MICLCLTGSTISDWTRQLDRNRRWISAVELRVDLLRPSERSPAALSEWWRSARDDLTSILTVRRPRDLGRWEGDEAQRLFLLSQLVEVLEPDYLDLELDRARSPGWVELARAQYDRGGAVVRSHHEPKATPEELAPLIARLATDPHEVPKLAVYSESCSDVVRLLGAVREFHRRMPGRKGIWIAMGEYGLPSRVAPSHFGSAWTYASDDDEVSAAPGHVSPRVLHDTYRIADVRADWPLFAVLGAPVAHSHSPEYHNRRFREDGHDALYIPVRADDFTEFEALAEHLDIRGVSVTVPHKRAALAFGEDGASERARAVGAANTLWIDRDGLRRADNTDVEGFLEPLRALLGDAAAGTAVVIGAGGAARSAVAGLAGDGWTVEVYNRTPERAAEMLSSMGLAPTAAHPLAKLAALKPGGADLLVQTTPVGMRHGSEGDPSAGYRFAGTEVAYDMIYTPPETEFLRRARESGARTINGEAMFLAQADAQYHIFASLL